MAKILNGSAMISYGPLLPPTNTTPDGSLFFKTDSGTGGSQGLYMFGFIQDANTGALGYQPTQDWVQATSPDLFVSKSGDTMTGALTVPSFLKITQAAGAQRVLLGNQDGSGTNKPSIIEAVNGIISMGTGDSWTGSGGTLNLSQALVVNGASAVGLTFRGAKVWTAENDGAGSGLNADLLDGLNGASYVDLPTYFLNGALRVEFGGLGTVIPPAAGAVLYGAGVSVSAVLGGTNQVLISQGAAAPKFVDQSTLSVGNASTANTANSATTATTATTAQNALSVPWTGIVALNTATQTFPNSPASGFTAHAKPALFYDMGSSGALSMTPPQFNINSISGFDSFTSSDIGAFHVGLTVVGGAGGGARAMQLAANWNFEEGAPNGLKFRVNDNTGNTGVWGAFRTLWDQGNLTDLSQLGNAAGYAKLASPTFSGQVTTPTLVVQSNASVQGTLFTSVIDGNIGAFNRVDTSAVLAKPANNLHLDSAEGATGVFLNYFGGTDGTFFGNGSSGVVARVDAGGNITANGSISSGGNISAFSDSRLKTDISTIPDALAKVQGLNGVNFTDIATGQRRTGLIAQDVQAVLPEAVSDNGGMLALAYGNLAGLFVEAIKAQQLQITELTEEVQKLNRRLIVNKL